jgi:hypothetical protein
MVAHIEHATRCALCKRSLLVGEQARTFTDPRTRGVHTVCPLCTSRAVRVGWEMVGEFEARRPIPVQVDNVVDHERLVMRLQTDLRRLESNVDGTRSELDEARSSAAQLQQRVDALLEELAEARRRGTLLEGEVEARDQSLRDAERRLEEAQESQDLLLRARRREADAAYMCGIAAEVFNRSPHLATVIKASEGRGEPVVRIGVDGSGLPRPVRVVFAWQDASRAYRVTCDLVARLFDIEDLALGGVQPGVPAFEPNAVLRDGRLVLLQT